jgi:heterotetrameric sarcosine oxidase gamma subunit
MLDPIRNKVASVSVLSGRTSVRLKSWLPHDTSGVGTVEIDGRLLLSLVGITSAAEPRILCLAPNEWLLVSDVVDGPELCERIERQARPQNIAVLDVSKGLAAVRIEGPTVCDLLSKGCGLDLHSRTFPEGLCARTRFAQIPAILDRRERYQFDLYVGRSYLAYLQAWLTDAAT